ncbi:MAG TPA: YihY/virulence factor BrkB family protein [Chitinophagales bacterium]|nr:YihY/virulence factor BrkB family protein [Chitinophagales bacterium]HMX03295.1 YihY/virulence factor BrkB family protein [Chitinophagales bacterium]HMZ88590.1 YihY/virulence factor BrkB family protein [Chitinophagales bacterium]HNA57395.1 YihY/virulence factor BrkB family protein [Chitinophagales bacterium]HNE46560.1 YihY/virulence factor BrkB family protein [Chitinophagales bacterium]
MKIIPSNIRRLVANKYARVVNFTKRTSFPGFAGIPIYDVISFFWQEIRRDQLPVRASAISFNFLLAIFPSIIFVFTLIPYIPIKGLDANIHDFFRDVLPESGYAFLESTITGITSIKRGGLLSVGFILAFYFSTNGVRMLMLTFNKSHPIYQRRNFWRNRIAAFRLTFYLFLLFIVSIITIVMGDKVVGVVGDWINWEDNTGVFFLNIFQYAIILILFFFGISLIYYYGPAVKHRWRFITPGGTFATIVSIAASVIFGYAANNLIGYNEVYGSIGTLIVLMIWINLNALVLLVGFEINNSVDVNRVLRSRDGEDEQHGTV